MSIAYKRPMRITSHRTLLYKSWRSSSAVSFSSLKLEGVEHCVEGAGKREQKSYFEVLMHKHKKSDQIQNPITLILKY